MTITALILLVAAILLTVQSAFMSGAETAFFSLDEIKIRHFKTNDVRMIRKLFKNATLLLASILIANTTTNVLLTTILDLFFKELGYNFDLLISTIVVSGLIIVFGEILPKSFASAQGQALVPVVLSPLTNLLNTLKRVAEPIHLMAKSFTDHFTHLLPESESKEDRRAALYNIVARGSFLKTEEKVLIGRVLSLAERKVVAVMTPRPRVFSIEDTTTLSELKDMLAEEPFSKIPVYKEKDSNVIGVLYFEDIALQINKNQDMDSPVSQYIKPIYFIPESKTLGSLFEDFRAQSGRIAGVVDEYGDFLGIVTLNDIMVELVGEVVDDDYDEKDQDIMQQMLNRYIVKGEVSLIDFNKSFNTNLISSEYETIAGFLIEQAKGIPPLFYTFETENIVITVRERSATRIESLSVRVKA